MAGSDIQDGRISSVSQVANRAWVDQNQSSIFGLNRTPLLNCRIWSISGDRLRRFKAERQLDRLRIVRNRGCHRQG